MSRRKIIRPLYKPQTLNPQFLKVSDVPVQNSYLESWLLGRIPFLLFRARAFGFLGFGSGAWHWDVQVSEFKEAFKMFC